MGQKTTTDSISAVFQAFLQQRTWKQPELARHVGIGVPALRPRLKELSKHGMPLTRDDDPPDVLWSVSKDWFPDAVALAAEDLGELLRLLGRLPRSSARDRFIKRIIRAGPRKLAEAHAAPSPVIPPPATPQEETCIGTVEDSAARQVALAFTYFTVSRNSLEPRYASVQRITIGPPARFLAVCHRDGKLKWFRLENVYKARLDEREPYRTAAADEVDTILNESLDGYHQRALPVRCSFVVEEAEARWVERNLPGPMAKEAVPGGQRFTTTTAGVLRLARFVVGLGRAARIETPELAALVRELARGAVESLESADASLNEASVSSNG